MAKALRNVTPLPSRAKKREAPAPLSRETLLALAPAASHLLCAVSEVIAAAQAAFEVLPTETRDRSRWSIRSARAALDLVGRLALSGAERTRRQARATLKAETAREILAALDARASRLDPRAAGTLDAVRDAVADALGAERVPAPRRATRTRPAARRLRRIPPVSFDRDAEPADE